MKASLRAYGASLVNPKFAPTSLKVALLVGSLLFAMSDLRQRS